MVEVQLYPAMIPGGGFSDPWKKVLPCLNGTLRKPSQCWGFCLPFHCAIKQYVSILGSISDAFPIIFLYGDSMRTVLLHQKLPLFPHVSRAHHPWITTLMWLLTFLFLTVQDCNAAEGSNAGGRWQSKLLYSWNRQKTKGSATTA